MIAVLETQFDIALGDTIVRVNASADEVDWLFDDPHGIYIKQIYGSVDTRNVVDVMDDWLLRLTQLAGNGSELPGDTSGNASRATGANYSGQEFLPYRPVYLQKYSPVFQFSQALFCHGVQLSLTWAKLSAAASGNIKGDVRVGVEYFARKEAQKMGFIP